MNFMKCVDPKCSNTLFGQGIFVTMLNSDTHCGKKGERVRMKLI